MTTPLVIEVHRANGHSALTRVELVTPSGERFILPASSVVVTDEFPKATTVTFTVPARVEGVLEVRQVDHDGGGA